MPANRPAPISHPRSGPVLAAATNRPVSNRPVSATDIRAALGDDDASTVLRDLLARAKPASHDKHEFLYHEGGLCDTVYFIVGGVVKLIIHLPNGSARIVRLHKAGSVLCLNGLFDRRSEHTAVALTEVTTLSLPIGAVRRLRHRDPLAYAGLLERWYRHLHDADTWIAQFSTGPIRSRVARLVAFLSDFAGDGLDGTVQLLTCLEMGSMLGVTSESVSRVLAEFKRRDILISGSGGEDKTYVVDLERLRAIAEQ